MKPFRWNMKKKEQLGQLLKTRAKRAYQGYEEELAECAAQVVGRSGARKLIFVGRSPENIFDYLSGIFEGTSYENQIALLNISNRFRDIEDIQRTLPASYQALQAHFLTLGIGPEQILTEKHGVCFSDLVAEGGTFGKLFEFLQKWVQEERFDFPAVLRKLSFLGMTYRKKTSPNTWRWQQNADWVKKHRTLTVKNVSIPLRLWDYLGNRQFKVAKTNFPERWNSGEILLPPREEHHIQALSQAFHIYCSGQEQRTIFAERLAKTPEFKEPWLRTLVHELKQSS